MFTSKPGEVGIYRTVEWLPISMTLKVYQPQILQETQIYSWYESEKIQYCSPVKFTFQSRLIL